MRRIKKELRDLAPVSSSSSRTTPAPTPHLQKEGIKIYPYRDGSVRRWKVVIEGPAESLYEGIHFVVGVSFPVDYPLSPPHIQFETACWHPNVFLPEDPQSESGKICIDILHKGDRNAQRGWSPAITAYSALIGIRSMLLHPNTASPLNALAATQFDHMEAAASGGTEREKLRKVIQRKHQASPSFGLRLPTSIESRISPDLPALVDENEVAREENAPTSSALTPTSIGTRPDPRTKEEDTTTSRKRQRKDSPTST